MKAPDGTLFIPEGMDLIATPEGVTVRRRWRTWTAGPLIVFAIIWDAFLVFWYTAAFHGRGPANPIMLWFPLAHVGVGLGLPYYIVATFLNRTDITINSAVVRVWSGPLPWIGNREVPVDAITRIVVRERIGSKGSRSYRVFYVTPGMRETTLLSLKQQEQAEYVAVIIRSTLGLPEA